MWQMLFNASLFIKLILFVLSILSTLSWGITLYKYMQLNAATQASRGMLEALHTPAGRARRPALLAAAETHPASPVAALVQAAAGPHAPRSIEALRQRLANVQVQELEKLEAYLIVLATTGSTAPFIGLLGTVGGIMDAFRGIASAQSASLAVVAPAISEALVATAAGLAAAIPAVMAYNFFVNRIRTLHRTLEGAAAALQEQLAGEPA